MSSSVKTDDKGRMLFVGNVSPENRALLDALRAEGLASEVVARPERAVSRIEGFDFVLMGGLQRGDLPHLRRVGETRKPVGVVLRQEDKSTLGSLSLKAGARSIFIEEVYPGEVIQFAENLQEEGLLRREVRWLRSELQENYRTSGVVSGESAATNRLRREMKRAVKKYRTILLRGEFGVRFDEIARSVHQQFPGLRYPFLHWEAARQRPVQLERALARLENGRGEEGELLQMGGTLFVENVQMLSADLQKRLGQVVGREDLSPNFRLTLAETQDPERLFHDELAAQLQRGGQTLLVRVPPLRDRKKDIPKLASSLLKDFSDRVHQDQRILTPGAMEWVASQPWWGNESQLEVYLWRAYLLADGGTVTLDDLQEASGPRRAGQMETFFRDRLAAAVACLNEGEESDLYNHTIRTVERPLLELVLHECGGNQVKAAKLLGMNRNTLRRRLQELGLTRRPRPRSR
ncbi:MAG: sigma 54-interacting transcriptional regulator [bacterium]|nr:sigma 54-interacting transcriptional regulator [bacterium]